jgi:hypothetical protein
MPASAAMWHGGGWDGDRGYRRWAWAGGGFYAAMAGAPSGAAAMATVDFLPPAGLADPGIWWERALCEAATPWR